jgi:polysaccharide deacetylase 2 family uncharacterized protein YibQ
MRVLGLSTGYAGVIAPHRATFTASMDDLRLFLGNIFKRGLPFVDLDQPTSPIIYDLALKMNGNFNVYDLWLDRPDIDRESIRAKLAELEKISAEKGHASALFQGYPVSQEEVAAWISTLKDKDIVLAPLSVIIKE